MRFDARLCPIYLNCRDRCEDLKTLVGWLEQAGHERIIFLDNDSTWGPLLDYYRETPHEVVYLKQNLGPRSLWAARMVPEEPFAYSDPDVVPVAECPRDALAHFWELLGRWEGFPKAGFGLYTKDVPDNCPALLSERGLIGRHSLLGKGAYDAPVDTTFALYRVGGGHRQRSIRTGWPHQVRHMPWYRVQDPTEEERYYLDHARRGPDGSGWAALEGPLREANIKLEGEERMTATKRPRPSVHREVAVVAGEPVATVEPASSVKKPARRKSSTNGKGDPKGIVARKSGIIVDIGCGASKQDMGALDLTIVGMDRQALPGVDVVHDWNDFPWPFEDEIALKAIASHVVEHVNPADGHFLDWMNEVWRILKPDGQFAIAYPFGASRFYQQDPTHCNMCNQDTWRYFSPSDESKFYRFYEPAPWKVLVNFYHAEGMGEVILRKIVDDPEYHWDERVHYGPEAN